MYIDFDGMQTKELPNFKGGEKTFRADMFDDGDTKIMRGRHESGALNRNLLLLPQHLE